MEIRFIRASGRGYRPVAVLLAAGLLLSACAAEETSGDETDDGEADAAISDDEGDVDDAEDSDEDDDSADAGDGDESRLTIAIPEDIGRLHPHDSGRMSQIVNFENVTQALTQTPASSAELEPLLAESWENPDEETWRFNLRQGVEFSNGEPFNADAVVASYETMMDPETGSGHSGYFAQVEEAIAVDEHTVDFVTDGPAPMLGLLLSWLAILPPEASQTEEYERAPIGTGPYIYDEVDTDRISLRANPDYWGDAPEIEFVDVISRPDAASRVASVQTGEVDIAWDIPIEQVEEVPQVFSEQIREQIALKLKAHSGIMSDPLVREAVVLGIDNEGIRKSLLGEEFSSEPKCQWSPSNVFGHNPDLATQGYDPERARELVQEAGVEGETINFIARAGYPRSAEIAEGAALQLEEIGFEVDLTIPDYDTWLDALLTPDADYDIVLAGIGSEQGHVLQPMASVMRVGAVGDTFPHDDYPEFEEIASEAERTLDEEERERLLQEANEVGCEAHSSLFMYGYSMIWGATEGVEMTPRADNRIRFYEVQL